MAFLERKWKDIPAWVDQAACVGLPSEYFFLDEREETVPRFSHHKEKLLPGIAVCQGCPVLEQCREEAVMNPSLDSGIRGGMTTNERRKERRRRR